MNRINKVGIELEGHFDYIPEDRGHFKSDCSVDVGGERGRDGEFVSIPLSVDECEEWVLNNYPDHTNRSCGGHIHVSLKSASDYMDLMDREFYEYYLEEMKKWAKTMNINPRSAFWERIEGVTYCYARFQPTEQRDMRDHYDDPRYAHINYCYNVDNRHTLEFRLLPCFQKSTLMASATLKTIEIVENYLENFAQKQDKITMRIDL